ncbi:hypothetical protein LEWO105114_03830 [Legionella worsleiensis]|nr:Uncharacterised protein [Legionella worsleiensis]
MNAPALASIKAFKESITLINKRVLYYLKKWSPQ